MSHFRLTIALLLPLSVLLATADVSSDSVITCHGSVHRLTCDSGVISVLTAKYGRSDPQSCNEGRPAEQLRNTGCSLDGTQDLVKRRCDGKKVCELNSDDVQTSDPCVGTFKYLQTNYTCLPAIHLVLCEDSQTLLHCAEGQVISVYGADFGRRDRTTCSYKRPDSQIQNVDCWAPTSKVAQSCNGKNSCSVRAASSEFGDPCVGTYKYLEASYVCQYPV
ncbi:L-rhamnose-binding lectin SML-like [Acanthochromis polyacanthus]|uniref:L-rhamnose-binding lectin SML-like n=1 Tax=Acanthochromis polyacanthus TaxID=80966 RepID=UPI002234A30F|nr:L-rhamnose-binding lectin SML-like [Acanthochromis polyacanthus]